MYFLQARIETNTFTQIVLAGGIVIVLLAIAFLVFVVFARNRQNKLAIEQETMQKEFESTLLQSQVEVQEHTFTALGKELHDNVAQLLISTKMLLGFSRSQNPVRQDTLLTAEETLATAIQEIRTLSKALDKDWLSRFSLLENLQQEVNRINALQKLEVRLQHTDSILPVNADKQIILFRVVQEALQNALKYAGAKHIDISIDQPGNQFCITVKDDGKGFSAGDMNSQGMGLNNIKNRVKLLKGECFIESEHNKGTSITIKLAADL